MLERYCVWMEANGEGPVYAVGDLSLQAFDPRCDDEAEDAGRLVGVLQASGSALIDNRLTTQRGRERQPVLDYAIAPQTATLRCKITHETLDHGV